MPSLMVACGVLNDDVIIVLMLFVEMIMFVSILVCDSMFYCKA